MSDSQSTFRPRDPRFSESCSRWAKALRLGALAFGLLVAGLGQAVPSALATPTTMVDLGTASTYAVLSGASVGNTVNGVGAPHTTLRGDLGVKANAAPTGFPPAIVTGATNVGNPAAAQAHSDLVAAYNDVAGRAGGSALSGDLIGAIIPPGLHANSGAVANTGTVTLDGQGDPNAVFVFKIGGALDMAAASHVVLINGARASRVFWQVNGAGAIGAGASFAGTLMALNAVAVGNGTVVNGRAFARNGALTLDANEFYSSPPVVTIGGGAGAITTDTTPTISGTTDVEAPAVVTVTINGQTLTATPSAGGWSVTSAILANGIYPVVSSVSDGAGNPGTATQYLTVDTVLPVATLDGGPFVETNDPTPTIAGSSDVAPGTVVSVTVDSQTLTALVQSGGRWNITPDGLTDGTRTVTASVTDLAGNPGTVSQTLSVDTVPPAVAITGGATATTSAVEPTIAGTSDAAPGTIVTVSIAGQTMRTLLQANGTWNATPTSVVAGTWAVVAAVPDSAGNLGSALQNLTIEHLTIAVNAVAGTAVAGTTVTRGAGQKLAGSALSIGTKVTAPSTGPVVATARGTLKVNGRKSAIKFTTETAAVAAGQSMTLKLRPAGTRRAARAAFAKIKAAVEAGHNVTATITVKIVDAAGNTREFKRTVKIT